MVDIFTENLQRRRQDEQGFLGGTYGQREWTVPGEIADKEVSLVVDYVSLDFRTPGTKLHATQSFPLVIQDEKDIDAATDFAVQVIGKFDIPINNLRQLSVPLFSPSYRNFDDAGGAAAINPILYVVLLKVDLNSGTFKLEDLTWDLAHFPVRVDGSTSSLYADTDNFVIFNSVSGFTGTNGFELLREPATPDGGNGVVGGSSGVDSSGAYWWYDGALGDVRQHGDLGPFTGIHLMWNPPTAGGGAPAPTAAGDLAFFRISTPDPKPGSTNALAGRFPFAIGSEFGVTDPT